MSASNSFETDILKLIFTNSDFTPLSINGSTVPGSLYLSLHTADPTDSGSQSSSEATYGSYARIAVARSTSAWDVTGDTASNLTVLDFPKCTSSTNTITHFGVGTSASGTGYLMFVGALDSSLVISNGITPSFDIGELTVVAD